MRCASAVRRPDVTVTGQYAGAVWLCCISAGETNVAALGYRAVCQSCEALRGDVSVQSDGQMLRRRVTGQNAGAVLRGAVLCYEVLCCATRCCATQSDGQMLRCRVFGARTNVAVSGDGSECWCCATRCCATQSDGQMWRCRVLGQCAVVAARWRATVLGCVLACWGFRRRCLRRRGRF